MLPHLFQRILRKTHVPVFLVLFLLLPPNLKQRQSSFASSSLQNQLFSLSQSLQTGDPFSVSRGLGGGGRIAEQAGESGSKLQS